ncbi:sensor histidine kinase [Paenibacillus harenae]|uniref:sensor histidine kinase n=1 Tax=Paenibacillus harenae TaxID=306543 RepID=UPI0003F954A1|nr:ATP-binding protein [Paenibacillus harenae]
MFNDFKESAFRTFYLKMVFWIIAMFILLCIFLVTFINVVEFIFDTKKILLVSTIGFVLTIGIGVFCMFSFIRIAFRPLKAVVEATSSINIETLDTRMDLNQPYDELTQLARSFNTMLERIESAFLQQNHFVADAAHELRTPLATIRTQIEVIQLSQEATISQYQETFSSVERALHRLEQLVADMLILTMEKKQPIADRISILPVVEEAWEVVKHLAETRQVSLFIKGDLDIQVVVDEGSILRVFINMLENGIRYNRVGGEITIEMIKNSKQVIIRIHDTGIGIQEQDKWRIFDRFFRVDASRSRHKGGSGLGLSIVKYLMALYGAEVYLLESSPDGSTFILEFPL